MHYPRWYPTAVALADGRVLVLGGEQTPGVYADVPEIYDPSTDSWTTLPGAQLMVGEYPHSFVMPNGNLFMVAPTDAAEGRRRTLDLTTRRWTILGRAPAPEGVAPMSPPGRVIAVGGSTTGGAPASAATALIDLTQPSPAWRSTAPMAYGRNQHNLV